MGRAENHKNPNINLTQIGSNGTHKKKAHVEKEKNVKKWMFALESAFEKIDSRP